MVFSVLFCYQTIGPTSNIKVTSIDLDSWIERQVLLTLYKIKSLKILPRYVYDFSVKSLPMISSTLSVLIYLSIVGIRDGGGAPGGGGKPETVNHKIKNVNRMYI